MNTPFFDLLRLHGALAVVIAFCTGAVLLWLAAELATAGAGRPGPVWLALSASAAVLAACGLWWPGHLMSADGTAAAAAITGHWLLAAALAGSAGASAHFLASRTWAPALGATLATLCLGYVHALFATPGVFRIAPEGGWVSAGACIVLLAAGLVSAPLVRSHTAVATGQRGGAALLSAGVLWFSVGAPPGTALSAAPAFGIELPGLLLLTALAGVLLLVSRSAGGEAGPFIARQVRIASVDSLTRLPTRLEFERRLATAAKKCAARRTRLAVLFIDLDGFKPVNDTYGHSSGDFVLEQVGQRLRSVSRGSDVAARIGGDEFVVLATNLASEAAAAEMALRLIERLSRVYVVGEREVTITCSVGIAMFPDGCAHHKLIARADAAMYAAKRTGGSRHVFYAAQMDADAQQNFDLVADLRKALANNELELYYQPKIDAGSGKVTAAEALIRWHHPKRGIVMPGEFIPLAERSGLIGAIGHWVIEAACQQGRQWRDKGLRMRVAINLSAQQMRQEDIVDRIAEALARHRIHPSLLTCEITESAAMEDTRATQETFRRLGELGVHLSIDDFGTGYSSLAYLRQLPAQELKIDRSFVLDLETSADARAVVDAVVKLAHALGLKVVAEGIETPGQKKILVDLGCNELQGYLFAKPMSARALLLWALGGNSDSESPSFRSSLFGETRQVKTVLPAADARGLPRPRARPAQRSIN